MTAVNLLHQSLCQRTHIFLTAVQVILVRELLTLLFPLARFRCAIIPNEKCSLAFDDLPCLPLWEPVSLDEVEGACHASRVQESGSLCKALKCYTVVQMQVADL